MKTKLICAAITVFLALSAVMTAAVAVCPDYPEPEWYSYPYVVSAVENQIIGYPDTKFRPDDIITQSEANEYIRRALGVIVENDTCDAPLTRADAFIMLAKAIMLEDGQHEDLSEFPDASEVSDATVAAIGALVKRGYIKGSDGLLIPHSYMPREQFAAMIGRIFGAYVSDGALQIRKSANITVRTAGTVIQNAVIPSDCYISGKVGDGDVTLDGVVIKGRLIIRGGGQNSVHIVNGSYIEEIIVARDGSAVRVNMQNSNAGTLTTVSEGAIVNLDINSGVEELIINGKASYIDGDGSINKAYVNANGASLEIRPSELVITDDILDFSLRALHETTVEMPTTENIEDYFTPSEPSELGEPGEPSEPVTPDEPDETEGNGGDEPTEQPEESRFAEFENTSSDVMPLLYQDKEFILEPGGKIVFSILNESVEFVMKAELKKGYYVLKGDVIELKVSGTATVLNSSLQHKLVNGVPLEPGAVYQATEEHPPETEDPPTEPESPPDGDKEDEKPYIVLENGILEFDSDGRIRTAKRVIFMKGDFIVAGSAVEVEVRGAATLRNETQGPIEVGNQVLTIGETITADGTIF